MKKMNNFTYKIIMLIMISFIFVTQTPFLNGMFHQKQLPRSENKAFTARAWEWLSSFYQKPVTKKSLSPALQGIEKKMRGVVKVTLQAQDGPVLVSENLIKQSKTISNMLADMGVKDLTDFTMPINIEKFSMTTVKDCMGLLGLYQHDPDAR